MFKVESLQKALDEVQMDNRKLAQSSEQLLQENHNTQEKLNILSQRWETLRVYVYYFTLQTGIYYIRCMSYVNVLYYVAPNFLQMQLSYVCVFYAVEILFLSKLCVLKCYHVCHYCIVREVELKEARAEIRRLTEHIYSMKKLLKREKYLMEQVTLKTTFDWSELSGHVSQLCFIPSAEKSTGWGVCKITWPFTSQSGASREGVWAGEACVQSEVCEQLAENQGV